MAMRHVRIPPPCPKKILRLGRSRGVNLSGLGQVLAFLMTKFVRATPFDGDNPQQAQLGTLCCFLRSLKRNRLTNGHRLRPTPGIWPLNCFTSGIGRGNPNETGDMEKMRKQKGFSLIELLIVSCDYSDHRSDRDS